MQPVRLGPLSESDYKEINKRLADLERLRQDIEKAAEAGFPCAEFDDTCKAARDHLMQIKKVYFPDHK